MATNWNAILNNTNNLQDVLSILKKVLASLDVKADFSDLEGAVEVINGLDINVQEKLGTLAQELENFSQEKLDALNSLNTAKEEILTQVNNITTANSIDELNLIEKWEGRTVAVTGIGNYKYQNGKWLPSLIQATNTTFKKTTVEKALNRFKTYLDYGFNKPALGFNDAAFAAMFNDVENDNDIFLPARLSLSSALHGTGNNATLLSLLGNNGKSFKAQIVAGDTKLLSQYNMSEDVLIYAGVTGRTTTPTSNPIFTSNTITITDQADLSTVQVGTIIKNIRWLLGARF